MEPPIVELRFVAAHACGALRLRVPNPSAGLTAVGAAIALDECDDLLAALDDWLAVELDWRWEKAQPLSASSAARADFAGGRLETEWPLLRSVGMPPPSLLARLRWHDAPALLTLARLFLDDEEQAAIEPGGAVVLPESLQADWNGWLHLPDEAATQGLAVRLAAPVPERAIDGASPPSAPPSAPPSTPPSAGEGRACEVRLAISQPLQAPLLAGWIDPVPLLGALPERPTELWIDGPDVAGRPRLLAQGRLLPWGHGWAMRIDRLH